MKGAGTAILLGVLAAGASADFTFDERTIIRCGSGRDAAEDLQAVLKRITGTAFPIGALEKGARGIQVGLDTEIPGFETGDLGEEGYLLRSTDTDLYLIATTPGGLNHAVARCLHLLGCRWFFPGEAWEIVPRSEKPAITVNERSAPDFPIQRRIWYGYGAYAKGKADWAAWVRRNRMGGAVEISIGHTWHGLHPEKDFAAHPEWFAEVKGERKASKPCYSHPAVIERAVHSALARAKKGAAMISMTPPDGLGYCECRRCLDAAGVAETEFIKGSLFGRRKDGTRVNVTSETVFALVNRVAAAVSAEHPRTRIGCYAYSAYSHPPSFTMHANAYLQTTTAYRRTEISLEEQLAAFGAKTRQLGIREYYSVYQWDWDYPHPGKLTPRSLQQELRSFRDAGVSAVNAEASNNWIPRGLGYYIAAQLMWDADADVNKLLVDFYQRAFGPAAGAMERYYVRWYGPEAAVSDGDLPARARYHDKGRHDLAVLQAACADIDAARTAAAKHPEILARLDPFRMYLHYLRLRHDLERAAAGGDAEAVRKAIRAETEFGGRLTDLHVIHTRPLLGKAFPRRFRAHAKILEGVDTNPWRRIGEPPGREELDALWQADQLWMSQQVGKNQ